MNRVSHANSPAFLIRPRINELLAAAVKSPLIIVCAGSGYGKTHAVAEFIRSSGISAVWMQLSEQCNDASHFWEYYMTNIAYSLNIPVTKVVEIGFPDSDDKYNRYIALRNTKVPNRKYVIVLDDFHLINSPAVIGYFERIFREMPRNVSIILICRELPKINISSLQVRGLIPNINDDELIFTEHELDQYFQQQGLLMQPETLHKIYQDTKGWAFSINLIARSLKRSPEYSGYVRSAVKQNIFKLMETEVWGEASERLRHFMARISLIDHLSADLVSIFAAGDENLLFELSQQNAYVRFNTYTNAYLIHHLFLDFLRTKQGLLTEGEKRETYELAAGWCRQNRFLVDALMYYEKAGDYESIVSVFLKSLINYMTPDVAQRVIGIFERAPEDTFDRVEFFAVMHLCAVMCSDRVPEFFKLAEHYEKKFLKWPEESVFRNHTLAGLYLYWGHMRILVSNIDHNYNFDEYYAKMADCLIKAPSDMVKSIPRYVGAWVSLTGSSKKGAPLEFISAIARMVKHVSRCSDVLTGIVDLVTGELLFYQGDFQKAESHFTKALNYAREFRQFEAVHISLFSTARIAVFQGNYEKADKAVKDMEIQLHEKSYPAAFISYDIAVAWLHYILRQPENFPVWLKERFTPYSSVYYADNFGNQMKARYHYLTKNYEPLLTYLEDMKNREMILYDRLELLAIEACAYYNMKDKTAAFAALREAYETASPNGILTPFLEMGQDMRLLTAAALREPDSNIPREWLETVKRRSATYAKYHSLLLSDYMKASGRDSAIALSSREKEILLELYHGLTRSEIAAGRMLSLNTVNSIISGIFHKLDAHSTVDVIRIAKERNLV